MIGRKSRVSAGDVGGKPQSFDDFRLRLGDVMRGERATLGKSLLDVQRELRIKASYIAAIENCDPSAFDTPGFIAGYVRSYARYLGMDPDEAFNQFCSESGFSVAHGMSERASTIRKPSDDAPRPRARDPLAEPNLPFAPASDSFLSRVEPGAVGSTLVLLALVAGIGYGGWAVLKEVQRVQVSPVEQTPVVLSELDPLDAAMASSVETDPVPQALRQQAGVFTPPAEVAFDRLYRPQALDVPVLVARDAPISTLDPEAVGVFAGARLPDVHEDPALAADALTVAATLPATDATQPQLPRVPGQGVMLIAVRPSWVEVKDGGGRVLYSRIMNAGDTFAVPANAQAPVLKVGESGSVYFAVNGTAFGPAGARGSVTSSVSLTASALSARYSPVEAGADADLVPVLAALDIAREPDPTVVAAPAIPRVLADAAPGVTIVATSETWVEVTSASGTKLIAKVMQAGETYTVPQTDQPPTIFSGNAGGVYFAVNGQTFGPYGASGQFGRGLALEPDDITQKMAQVDLTQRPELARIVAELRTAPQPRD